ncbi:mucin-5AC isoform X4 [Esox lucius]|uniref:mucin-5AC isoform X4 n=1 Tax=Esox lucius TaxID=8010 RepID=UPI0014773942|nr:mucin-5AC isoform X4 [Esox lucius]
MTLVFANQTLVPSTDVALAAFSNSTTNLTIVPGSINVAPDNTTAAPNASSTAAPHATSNAALNVSSTAAPNVSSTAAPHANSTAAPNANSTTAPAPSDPPSPSEGSLSLQFSLNQNFTSDLADQNSQGFKTLATKVVSEVNNVYRRKFASFLRSLVKSFRSGSVVTDMTLVFANQTLVPSTDVALAAFSNSTTNLTIVPGSINVAPDNTTAAPNASSTAAPHATSNAAPNVSSTAAPNVSSTAAPNANSTAAPNATSNAAPNATSTAAPHATSNAAPNASSTVAPNATSTAAPNATLTPAVTTTTALAPSDPPSPSEGSLSLQFSLNQNFTSDLADQNSQGFKTLATKVVSEVNNVYRRKFASFLRSLVKSFRSGSVVTDMTLVFANQTLVPSTDVALAAFSNSTTNLTIVPGSINVAPDNTTAAPNASSTAAPNANSTAAPNATSNAAPNATSTAAPHATSNAAPNASSTVAPNATSTAAPNATLTPAVTTTTALAPSDPPSPSEGSLSLQFSLNQNFTSDLADQNSQGFKTLATKVVSEVNNVYRRKFASFLRSLVKSFRSGSVVTDMTLVFANQTLVPSTDVALAAFSNSTTNLTIVPGSINVAPDNTTAAPNASSTAAPNVNSTAAPNVNSTAAPNANSTAAPNATSTAAPKTTLTAAVTTTTTAPAPSDPPSPSEGSLSLQFSLNQNFTSDLTDQNSQGFKTLATKVVSEVNNVYRRKFASFLRSLVKSFRSGSVVTDMTLVFANQTLVPSTDVALAAFSNSTTNLTIVPGSINVAPDNTTAAPNVNSTAAPNATSTAAPNATLTAAVTTTTTAPAPSDPPSPSEGSLSLQFSLNQNFTSDLADQNSQGFKTLATKVVSEVNKVYSKKFASFLRSLVKSFRSGSVVTNLVLVFTNKSSVPSIADVQAASSSIALDILPNSTIVSPTSSAHRPTVFCLAVLPVTLALLLGQLVAS